MNNSVFVPKKSHVILFVSLLLASHTVENLPPQNVNHPNSLETLADFMSVFNYASFFPSHE